MTAEWHSGLAATKLHPPVPPAQLVRRSRLDTVLDDSVARRVRLILASAPAGSGKSTMLSSWLARRPEAAAWLQVEDSDSDPARFWRFLVEAIDAVVPGFADAVGAVVSGSAGDDREVVPALVNHLAGLSDPLVIVLDDYQLIEHAGIHRGVERLITLCPQGVTLVVATRIDPPFRLGRLRVANQLTEVRSADLRFHLDEAAGLLGPVAHLLAPAQLERLLGRTEGWAAGLVLAGLSLGRAPDPAQFVEVFGGDDQLVVDYLTEELLAGAEPAHRQRLLETSILEQLDGGLVDAVTDGTGGASWLRETAGSNQLLVGLDSTGDWFRYHHLLRDLLRLEARRTFPEHLPELHRRAAAWFDAHDDHRQAMLHLLAAGDHEAAARRMRFHGTDLLRAGQIDTLRGLLERLGDASRTDTACALLYGWCEYIAGRYDLAEQWLDTALAVAPDGFDPTFAVPLRINISLAGGDVATALRWADAVPVADRLASQAADLSTACGAAYTWAGRADDARAALAMAVDKAPALQNRTAHVLALVYLAIVELDDGATITAHVAASEALDTARQFGLGAYHGVAAAYAVHARTDRNPERAHVHTLHAVELARRSSTALALGFVLTTCADTLLASGEPAGAPLLVEARKVIDRCVDPGIVGRVLARTESRHGRAAERAAPAGVVEPLTERELAVLRYLPTQLSQRDISHELFVSLNTVKTHCSAIYRKLAVGDRKAAVQAARDLGLL